MYWAWKNIKDLYPNIGYVGLSHYRRLFNPNKVHNKHLKIKAKVNAIADILLSRPLKVSLIDSKKNIHIYSNSLAEDDQKKIETIVKNNDLVCTTPIEYISSTVGAEFQRIGRPYIDTLRTVIESLFPQYLSDFNKVITGRKLPAANMIILKYEYFDDYCNFIFSTLECVQERLVNDCVIKDYNEKIYSRVPGYLAELLTATYILYFIHKNMKVAYLNKYFII